MCHVMSRVLTSCHVSRVRWEVVTGRQDIILPSGEVIHFTLELEAVTGNLTQEEAGHQHRDLSLVYENTGDGSEGVLTYSPDTGAVFGTFETGDTGTIYTLEVGTIAIIYLHFETSMFTIFLTQCATSRVWTTWATWCGWRWTRTASATPRTQWRTSLWTRWRT